MKNGGMTYLRVSDDGCGIAPSELPTAFSAPRDEQAAHGGGFGRHRHAGLPRRGARGDLFRFSARHFLARARRAQRRKAPLEGGVPGTVEDAGCPEGTSIIVRDLFYNTPARLKFMKRDSAEATAIAGLVGHLALSHPEVSFKLIKDGTQTLFDPRRRRAALRHLRLSGREFTLSLA